MRTGVVRSVATRNAPRDKEREDAQEVVGSARLVRALVSQRENITRVEIRDFEITPYPRDLVEVPAILSLRGIRQLAPFRTGAVRLD